MFGSLQLIIFCLEAGFRFWAGIIWDEVLFLQLASFWSFVTSFWSFVCAMWPMASGCLILGTLGKPQPQKYDQLVELSLWAAVCTPCWVLTWGKARGFPSRGSQSFSSAEFGPLNAVQVHQVSFIKSSAITFLALLGFTGVILWYFTVSNQVNVNINCKMNQFFFPSTFGLCN